MTTMYAVARKAYEAYLEDQPTAQSVDFYGFAVDEDGTRADLGAVAKLKSRRLFIRGDLDGNGMVDVTDAQAIFTLVENKLRIACMESADVDGNGIIGRQDGVRLMNFLMTGQNPPAPPWPVCGPTPKTASPLGCFENRCKP